jgi:nitrate/nitrite-specific signal transduction histidine kinase
VANHLYRIAQEAVTNAVKHGAAKAVRLQLSATRGKVRLVIADDGRGLPPTFGARDGQSGMGLRIMRYRARIARGEVRVERGERVGTRVVCECPLQTHAGSRAKSTRVRLHRAAAKQGATAVKRGAPLRRSKAKSTGV